MLDASQTRTHTCPHTPVAQAGLTAAGEGGPGAMIVEGVKALCHRVAEIRSLAGAGCVQN